MSMTTLPTDACTTKSHPLPRHPNGWYGVLRSDELGRGKVVPLRMFGRELVAFRGEDGQAHVLNAFCPHLGAHLGHGSRVVGAELVCPFHGWRFGGNGRCSHVPFVDKAPRVGVRSWPVREHSGFVFVHHHVNGAAPTFEVPEIPEMASPRYHRPTEIRSRWRAHVQEPRENIVDASHFYQLHGQSRPAEQTFVEKGPFASVAQDFEFGPWKVRFTAEMVGPGVMVVRTSGLIDSCAVALTNPIDEEWSEMRWFGAVKNPLGMRLLGMILQWFYIRRSTSDIRAEDVIYEHKTYLERPVLMPHESGIRRLRAWYAQFYEGAQAEEQGGRPARRYLARGSARRAEGGCPGMAA